MESAVLFVDNDVLYLIRFLLHCYNFSINRTKIKEINSSTNYLRRYIFNAVSSLPCGVIMRSKKASSFSPIFLVSKRQWVVLFPTYHRIMIRCRYKKTTNALQILASLIPCPPFFLIQILMLHLKYFYWVILMPLMLNGTLIRPELMTLGWNVSYSQTRLL